MTIQTVSHQGNSQPALSPQPNSPPWPRGGCPTRSTTCRLGVALGLLVLHLSFCLPTLAQYSIGWYRVSGGGGVSTGGRYSIGGTVGQHDAGGMSGGGYSLTGGFWALYAVQTPGAPTLSIGRTSTNTAMVYWPSPSLGWNLQVNTNLSKANWFTPPETVQDNGTVKYIIVNPPTGKRFYRLNHP
jgi:hypothetical protein